MLEERESKNLRLFVAVPLWKEFREGALPRYCELRKKDWPLKWVKPENWHLTLKFLGDTPASGVREIRQSIRNHVAGSPEFEIELGGLGGFPRLSKMRVFWVGVREGREALVRVADSVDKACVAAGYPGDRKKFQAHLTLARARSAPVAVDVPKDTYSGSWGTQVVGGVCLVQSTLEPGGAKYEVLEEILFGSI